MAGDVYDKQKVEALQALNEVMLQILHELRTIRQAQQAIAQKR